MAKKNPDGEKCERKLPFRLNDEELARKGEMAAGFNTQIAAAVEKKKAEMAKHNAKIGDLTEKRDAQLAMISEGVERREVTCVEFKNYDNNLIEWYFEGVVLESREMKPEDRQMSLAEKKPAKGEKPKWQKLAPKYKPKEEELTDEEKKSAEIASVHKLESSRKGASSSVDPK